jgi:hypothetical protein
MKKVLCKKGDSVDFLFLDFSVEFLNIFFQFCQIVSLESDSLVVEVKDEAEDGAFFVILPLFVFDLFDLYVIVEFLVGHASDFVDARYFFGETIPLFVSHFDVFDYVVIQYGHVLLESDGQTDTDNLVLFVLIFDPCFQFVF